MSLTSMSIDTAMQMTILMIVHSSVRPLKDLSVIAMTSASTTRITERMLMVQAKMFTAVTRVFVNTCVSSNQ